MSVADAAAAFPYAVHLDTKFEALDLIDVTPMVMRPGLCIGLERDGADPRFLPPATCEIIDLEGRSVALSPQQGFVVPKGVIHRTRFRGPQTPPVVVRRV
jgi:hypothetical protein